MSPGPLGPRSQSVLNGDLCSLTVINSLIFLVQFDLIQLIYAVQDKQINFIFSYIEIYNKIISVDASTFNIDICIQPQSSSIVNIIQYN